MYENKILVISNNVKNIISIQQFFRKEGYISTITDDVVYYIDIVKDCRPNLIIIDTLENNIQILKNLRAQEFLSVTPIVIIAATDNEQEKLDALDIGVDDYMVEPINTFELFLKIRNIIKRIYASRWTNPLTGLPSNTEINSELEKRISEEKPFAAIYLDLDNFKAYNDVYGFSNGDRVIKYTGDVIKSAIAKFKGVDTFAGHIGGDDFLVVTPPDICEEFAKIVIKKFDKNLPGFYSEEDRKKKFVETTDRQGKKQQFPLITISIAIVTNEKRLLYSPIQIGEIAAELKKCAKAIEGSVYCKDRRRG